MLTRTGRGDATKTDSNLGNLGGCDSNFVPKPPSPSAPAPKPCGGSDVVLGLASNDEREPVLGTKADKLSGESEKKCKKARKKWSKWFSLRKKKSPDATCESRKLGPFIENRNWEDVRAILHCAGSVPDCAKEQISADQHQNDEKTKSKGSQCQQVLAALDQLVDYSGQNALHHMCRFQPPIDVITHVIDICSRLPLGLDCLERMPLHVAAGWGSHPEVIVKLLEASQHHLASMQSSSDSKRDDSSNFPELLGLCLQRVAGKPDMHGKTPLHFAAENLSVQVSRTYGKFGPAFASAVNSKSAEHSLRVLKILADACPEATDQKDDDGMTPSDIIIGRRCLREGVAEDEVRRKAVRYLNRARGRKARLRSALGSRRKQSSEEVNHDNGDRSLSSSDSSLPTIGKRNCVPRKTASPGSEDNRLHSRAAGCKDEPKEDDILAARLLELMGCSAEDTKAMKRDDASIERMRQVMSSHQNCQNACDAPKKRSHKNRSSVPPVDSIEITERHETEDDDISAITPPKNVPGWLEGKPTSENESKSDITENT